MNFNEAMLNLQHSPSPSDANLTVIPHKAHFHSRSSANTFISEDELAIALKEKRTHKPRQNILKHTVESNSDTYDDEFDIDTETEDYCSENDLIADHSPPNHIALQHGIKLFDTNIGAINHTKPPLHKSKSKCIHSLRLPNGINESDEDNYDSQLSHSINNLTLPKLTQSTKMHMRSYSESNIQKSIQKNQWPSSPSSDDSIHSFDESNQIKSKFESIKKKFKKQRRISRQLQDAITVIQDSNEDNIQQTEEQIRDKFKEEFEIKMIELEHQKLNTAITIEDKMKQILYKNDELMLQNKLLQQQVNAQVAMIQEQQTMAFEQQRSLSRMHSGDSPSTPLSSMHSPMLFQFPSTHTHSAILRRVSSASTINTPILPPNSVNVNAATKSNLSLHALGLRSHSSLNSNQTLDDANYTLNDDIHSIATDNSHINIGDMHNKYSAVNMEPNHSKYKHKSHRKRERKMKEIEQRLLHRDSEAKEFVGRGQTPWDRFINLMTPSLCTCSPHVPIQKSID